MYNSLRDLRTLQHVLVLDLVSAAHCWRRLTDDIASPAGSLLSLTSPDTRTRTHTHTHTGFYTVAKTHKKTNTFSEDPKKSSQKNVLASLVHGMKMSPPSEVSQTHTHAHTHPLPSDRQHLSYDVCLEVRGEIIRTVLCCIVY